MSSADLNDTHHNILKRTEGYNYHTFFPIVGKQDEKTIKLKFKVLAESDAHLLLSPCKHPDIGSPVYEIVLGARNNTYSTIRQCQQGDDEATTDSEESLVSPDDWRKFWIKIKKNKIKIGRNGKKAFLKWKDSKCMPINYFSVSSYNGAVALWILPCFKNKDS
ncbi:uncharacterized protein LOC135833322 [Planococcus citri]|uniref:uncharacterized protein LOC135833322 n=1 Tax=Planococcus citri TaxID=170843 RepID=UPI0031F976F1